MTASQFNAVLADAERVAAGAAPSHLRGSYREALEIVAKDHHSSRSTLEDAIARAVESDHRARLLYQAWKAS